MISSARACKISAALRRMPRRKEGAVLRHEVKAEEAASQARVAVVGSADTAWWRVVDWMEEVTGKRESGEGESECAEPLIQRGTMGRESGEVEELMNGILISYFVNRVNGKL